VLEALVKLWQEREGTSEDVPEVREARRLHRLRNNVQHEGLAPSSDQVIRSRLPAQEFLAWVATSWFGVELETISRAQLIENRAVRELVEQAEKAGHDDD
jgi:hypothetical protein